LIHFYKRAREDVEMIPPGTVCCILCRGMIAYRNNDTTRFTNHMNYEHGAYFDMEFLLAACLMDEEERKAVRNVMELKYKSQKKENQEVKSSPQKRPIASVSSQDTNPTKIPRTENEIVVKKEVSDEIRILPEDWDVPKSSADAENKEEEQRVMFKCEGCDKSFLHRKSLQTHQVKTGHAVNAQPAAEISNPVPSSKVPAASEFSCKVSNCKYTGSKSKDLQSHVTRMHKTATPTPPISATPPPGAVLTQEQQSSELFSNMAKSWAKKKATLKSTPSKISNKAPKVKKEPVDNSKNESLQENSENHDLSSDLNSSSASASALSDSICDSSIDTSMEVSSSETKTVEDTTFVAIDSTSSNDIDEVNISKSKYFKANPQTVSTLTEKGGEAGQFTVLDEKLPAGWKVKEITHEFKSGRKERKRNYLTPDLKILKTGLAVLEYMRLSGRYSAKEIMDYAKYLSVPVNRLEKYMELYL